MIHSKGRRQCHPGFCRLPVLFLVYGSSGKTATKVSSECESGDEVGIPISLGVSGGLLDVDDGRPRARGDVNESGDHHTFELHSPLPKAPLLANSVIEWEQLLDVSEPVRKGGLPTYDAVGLEICYMPQDTLGDLLDQLTFGHRVGWILVIFGGELPARFLACSDPFPAPNPVHIPASILPSHLRGDASVSSQLQCSKCTPKTVEKMSNSERCGSLGDLRAS